VSAHFDEVQLALHRSVYPEQPRMRWLGAWGRDETLLAAFDLWDLSGENIVEHLAEIEEFELAMATYPGRVRALARREHQFASWCGGDRTLASADGSAWPHYSGLRSPPTISRSFIAVPEG
jgi:hypothetical protein